MHAGERARAPRPRGSRAMKVRLAHQAAGRHRTLTPGAEKSSGSKSSETKAQSPNVSDQEKRDSGKKSSSDINKDRDGGKSQSETNKGASSDTKMQNNAPGLVIDPHK